MAKIVFNYEMQKLTDGVKGFESDARNFQALFREIQSVYPTITQAYLDSQAVDVDGIVLSEPQFEPIPPASEIHFVPRISGG